ncbi:MAG: preprotein translocase subunit SecG [Clostridia bacterium]|nr:preprotein translocase subunit SecG [Clostridia bacterium]MDE7182708.1 preprotein translocase subunit SecG [Clostridia bacterium]
MGANLLAPAGMSESIYTLYMVLSITCLVIIFLTALVAIILVLFQKSNSDGIQGITASSETFFGKNRGQSIESKLKKWTWVCMIILGVLSVVMYVVNLMVP